MSKKFPKSFVILIHLHVLNRFTQLVQSNIFLPIKIHFLSEKSCEYAHVQSLSTLTINIHKILLNFVRLCYYEGYFVYMHIFAEKFAPGNNALLKPRIFVQIINY